MHYMFTSGKNVNIICSNLKKIESGYIERNKSLIHNVKSFINKMRISDP